MAVAAFWIALAAVLIANSWRSKHVETLRHETLRLLIEKNSNLDAAQVKDLLYPPHPPLPEGHPWAKKRPGAQYRALRMFGTVLMIAGPGVGLAIASIELAQMAGIEVLESAADASGLRTGLVLGAGIGVALFLLGVGLIRASRFAPPPPEDDDGRPREI